MSVRLIVGLGNPGARYKNTRHNVGFAVVDMIADGLRSTWRTDKARQALLAGGYGVMLAKPQTYMNDSGRSVSALAHYFRIQPTEILVIYDDIALPPGTLRLRESGSAGGHNGMKSIIACLGTEKFPRLRVGIGMHEHGSLTEYVLGNFPPEQQPVMQNAIAEAALAAAVCVKSGLQAAASVYNRPPQPTPPPHSPRESTERN